MLLSAGPLSKSYNGVAALSGAALDVRAGEVHALMGENGAGKSTLIKILAGVVMADAGTVRVEDVTISLTSPLEAERAGLRFVHQELNIVPQLTVAENLFLGRPYPTRLGAFIDWSKVAAEAKAALAVLGISHIGPSAKMAKLSTGDRMLVKIASAFMGGEDVQPKLYIMDEPTAALSGAESERLFAVIAALKARGCGILYVSHRMDEVMRICSRVTVMRDGQTVTTMDVGSTSRNEIIELMTGRTIADAYPARTSPVGDGIALSVKGFGNGPLKDLSFGLRKGEILGIAGLAGSGQGALLRQLMGIEGMGERLSVAGETLYAASPSQAWQNGFAFVPRERRTEGLMLSHSVSDNVTLPHLGRINRLRVLLNRKAERTESQALASRVRLKSTGMRQPVGQLSGGNQQKVMFARAVAGSPQLLLLDEPTRGVDVGAKHDIYVLLRELSASGVSMLIASSDLPELIGMTDRVLVLRNGRQAALADTADLTQQALLSLCYGNETAPAQLAMET